MTAALVPELEVSDLGASLAFYELCGFALRYERPEEQFAYLARDGAELMLQGSCGPARSFHTAPLEPPYGRGLSLQIEVSDLDALLERLLAANALIVVGLEERWYRAGRDELLNRQFVVADPDGYLLRFFADAGRRSAPR